jgi:hypothetical protein
MGKIGLEVLVGSPLLTTEDTLLVLVVGMREAPLQRAEWVVVKWEDTTEELGVAVRLASRSSDGGRGERMCMQKGEGTVKAVVGCTLLLPPSRGGTQSLPLGEHGQSLALPTQLQSLDLPSPGT